MRQNLRFQSTSLAAAALCLALTLPAACAAQSAAPSLPSRTAPASVAPPLSASYSQVQTRLARGWNTWDSHSVATQVLLPQGLAIHVGLKHSTTLNGDTFLGDVLIGRLTPGAEQVTPGPHSWDGSYTDQSIQWNGHEWRIQSAHDGDDLLIFVEPLQGKPASALPPTLVFSVGYLWNRPGAVERHGDWIEAHGPSAPVAIYCTCAPAGQPATLANVPISGPYFAADFTGPVGLSTGKRRTLDEIQDGVLHQRQAYQQAIAAAGKNGPMLDAIETTLGWDTIYEPEKHRVVCPVSRLWSVGWGGYVVFDWDTFFAATMAGIGSKDLAYADALETLREETLQGFVPNYARAGNWKSSDRSEPPVGAITVLGLYRKFNERWLLEDAYEPLLKWNRWWAAKRDLGGYLTWGSDPDNQPANLDDTSRGTWQGAVYESGLDNSPMYDGVIYDPKSHLLQFADVGLMGLYIADCDALAEIAQTLGKTVEARELTGRATHYRDKLSTLWDDDAGIFLNKDLHTGKANRRLSPTNFYPLLARAATPEQARTMIEKHLLNPSEFWGGYVMPSIARNDPAFKDQEYWRGRIWGPMNYLVYLGLANYSLGDARRQVAQKSMELFGKEWTEKGHVHENYNAITGSGDDVRSSDRFYHWGALLGYIQYLEQERQP